MLASETKAKAGSTLPGLLCALPLFPCSPLFGCCEQKPWPGAVCTGLCVRAAGRCFHSLATGCSKGCGNEKGAEGHRGQWGRDHIFKLSAM